MDYTEYEKARNELGLKDSGVAAISKIGQSTFSDWKSGRSKPKEEKLQKILHQMFLYAKGHGYLEEPNQCDYLINFFDTYLVLEVSKPRNINLQLFSGIGALTYEEYINSLEPKPKNRNEAIEQFGELFKATSDNELKKAVEIAKRYIYATEKERNIVDQILEIDSQNIEKTSENSKSKEVFVVTNRNKKDNKE